MVSWICSTYYSRSQPPHDEADQNGFDDNNECYVRFDSVVVVIILDLDAGRMRRIF
jgi:hypothetical protein